jgi:hypothetical protein
MPYSDVNVGFGLLKYVDFNVYMRSGGGCIFLDFLSLYKILTKLTIHCIVSWPLLHNSMILLPPKYLPFLCNWTVMLQEQNVHGL